MVQKIQGISVDRILKFFTPRRKDCLGGLGGQRSLVMTVET